MKQDTAFLQIVEIFSSINGEGPLAGQLSVFVRLKGCNLSCSYCDTAWANEKDAPASAMTVEEICEVVDSEGIVNVTLTGGEPLLQKGSYDLIDKLCYSHSHHVEIETNGSIDITALDKLRAAKGPDSLAFTLDYKLPGSTVEGAMKTSNYTMLRPQDTVKFVCSDPEDCRRAMEIIKKYKLAGTCHIYLSPVFGKIDPADMVSFMNKYKLNGVGLQLQLHKIIWDPDMRGV